eukprot:SAG11_NODE_2586_length_3194_cov_3.871082_1_plen_402_part_00
MASPLLLLLLLLMQQADVVSAQSMGRSGARPNDPWPASDAPGATGASASPPYYGPPRGDACSGLWPLPRNMSCSSSDGLDYLNLSAGDFQFEPGSAAAKGSSLLHRAFERYHSHIFSPLRPHPQIKLEASLDVPKDTLMQGQGQGQGLSQLVVIVDSPNETLALDVDEAYSLEITTAAAHLSAPTVWGALRGLESFSQLISRTIGVSGSVIINSTYVRVVDSPRFPWRGIMIDTSRHWQPVTSIYAMIDALSFNKMSVLHWHITDAQSFPLKTKALPQLVKGAYGGSGSALHYDADDVKAIVAYAKDRGVRVVPEIDSPSHSDSWTIGLPDLSATKNAGYSTVLDPTNEETYRVLKALFSEIAEMFEDECAQPNIFCIEKQPIIVQAVSWAGISSCSVRCS